MSEADWRASVIEKMNGVRTNLVACTRLVELCAAPITLNALDLSQLHTLTQQAADELSAMLESMPKG